MITIIDYKSGNLKSISNGFRKLNVPYQITDDSEVIAESDYLVLPGVGAFGSAMENLKPFEDIINEHVQCDKPFLGICLGQQVLMSESEESPDIKGLNLFKGKVVKIKGDVKIPHMGWNKLKVTKPSPILDGIDSEYFYFVHSYHVVCDDEIVSGVCDYGGEIVSSLWRNNLFSTQFHPEKSGKVGLKILKNFTKLEI